MTLSRRTILTLAPAALMAAGGWAAMRARPAGIPEPMTQAALTVTAETLRARPLRGTVAATGTVVAWREVVVGAETGGLAVTALMADEGDHVAAGHVLATLSDGALRAQVDQQRAALVQAEAALDAARLQDRNAVALAPLKAISREEAEQRRAALRSGEGKRDAAAAALAEAEVRLGQARIVAPVSGTVTKRSVTAGSIAAVATEFYRIVQDDRVEVETLVPESEVERLRVGQAATVHPPSGPPAEGRLRLVPVTVDPKTRLGTARVSLPAGSGLRPGMFARVEILAEDEPVTAMPTRALVWRSGRPHAFRIDGSGKARLVPVRTGRQSEGYVEISGGMDAGDRVAVSGAGFLADGDPVLTAVAEAGVTP